MLGRHAPRGVDLGRSSSAHPQHRVDVGVHRLHDPAGYVVHVGLPRARRASGPARAARGGGPGSSRARRARRRCTGPCPGQTAVTSCASASARSRSQRVEVGAELRRPGAPRPSCRGRGRCRRSAPPAPAGSTNDSESEVCPGVPTTCTSRPSTSTTSPSPRPSAPSRCCGSRARTPQPDPLRERPGRLGVVGVAVGEQHDGDARRRTPRRRRGARPSSGPGSTTTDREAPVSRSTQVLVPSRVIMFGFGASTQRARSPNAPPRQAPGPVIAHRAATSSPSRTSRSGMDR